MRIGDLLARLRAKSWRLRREMAQSPVVYVPGAVIKATGQLVASYGALDEPHEGIAYWAGLPTETAWVVMCVLAPQACTTSGSYKTSAVANAFVIARVNELRLQILAQIHGHPSDWVGHSAGDDRGAFMPYPGFYSLVVPYYGRQGLLPMSKCGIHYYEGGRFVRLTSEEVTRRFIVVPTSVDLRKGPT